ncbi:MAG: phosphoglycerate dehydrogenase [Planctomycetes bacterium]|nr:phosphoglycerate dehydrogenase [Planctomycetota bacterium]
MTGLTEREAAAAVALVANTPFDDLGLNLLDRLRAAGIDARHPWPREKPEMEDFLRRVEEADYLIVGTLPVTRAVLDAAPRLRLVARTGIGLDSVDLAACRSREVVVTYTPDAPTNGVGELTVGLILDLARGVTAVTEGMRAGCWRRHVGRELARCTVGIVGFGRTGRRVAELLRPFGCRVLANDVLPLDAEARARGATLVDKETIFASADFVTLHVPATDRTRGLINAATLARMKPAAFLVNTSRGVVVDEAALLAALDSGRLAGAALDVFADEPYDGPLARHSRVVVTCHMGSCTDRGRELMETGAVEEVIRAHRGLPPLQPAPAE